MKLRITAVCDAGCLRTNNEDMALVGKKLLRDDRLQGAIELNEQHPIFSVAVADGMGGANAGEVASQMVLEGFREKANQLLPGLDAESLKTSLQGICQDIHQSILTAGAEDPEKSGMGSTIVALLFYEAKPYSMHAGDSRLYRFRNDTLMQLTEDHSMKKLVGSEEIPSNVIYNSFGGASSFFVTVDAAGKKALDGDIFLLCSDGVTDMLSDDEIEFILCQEGFEDGLLDKAKAKGGRDNISYILVELSGIEED